MVTVWVLGDQLNPALAAMAGARPSTHRVLLVESQAKLASQRWHLQRAHLVVASMRRFAAELRDAGFEVDERRSVSLAAGLAEHREEFGPERVVATEPASRDGLALLRRLDVDVVATNQFLCHPDDFAEWARGRTSFTMEHFYRWQRRRLGILMDGTGPAGGRWNYDADNRQPPPKDARERWPTPSRDALDDLDREVIAQLRPSTWGAEPDGTWATSRRGALARASITSWSSCCRSSAHTRMR